MKIVYLVNLFYHLELHQRNASKFDLFSSSHSYKFIKIITFIIINNIIIIRSIYDAFSSFPFGSPRNNARHFHHPDLINLRKLDGVLFNVKYLLLFRNLTVFFSYFELYNSNDNNDNSNKIN